MPFVRLKQSPEGLWPAEGWKGTSRSASWREVPKPSKPSQKDVLWDTWYERFLKVEPNSRGQRIVAQGFVTPDGARLGTWQHAQRRAYRRGSLDAKRRQRLDEAGIVWDPYEAAWEQGFSCYEDFPAELLSGKRIVSSAYITPGGYRLGKWQENQRQARRRGELSATRIARLEAAGMCGVRRTPRGGAHSNASAIFLPTRTATGWYRSTMQRTMVSSLGIGSTCSGRCGGAAS